MRTTSSRFKQEFAKFSTDECALWIVQIQHPTLLTTPVRITDNTQNVIHNGNTFVPFPFEIEYPDEAENSFGAGVLTCDNIDQDIYLKLSDLDELTEIYVGLVLGSQQNVNELNNNQGLVKFRTPGFQCTDDRLQATITRALPYDSPFPSRWITRQNFPRSA